MSIYLPFSGRDRFKNLAKATSIYLPFRGRDRFYNLAPILNYWTYRKSVPLSRASGAVTNYQMKLLVGESSGSTGEDVDCGGKCLSTFDDLRFTTSDGNTLLDYWIESISGTTPNQLATVWIEFNSIGTTATTFYMYYGNSAASAASNGTNTFIAFEDFEWGSDGDDIDTSGGSVTWSKVVAGTSTAKIDTGQCYQGTRSLELYRDGTNNPVATFAKVAGTDYAIKWWLRKSNTANAYIQHGNSTYALDINPYSDEKIYCNNVDTGYSCTVDTWQVYEATNINWVSATFDAWFQNNKIKSAATMQVKGTCDGIVRIGDFEGTGSIWVDLIIIRKWDATDPTWGSWGAEELL